MQHTAIWLGTIALVIASLAFVPSAAAFTPAIALSFLALAIAIVAACMGAWRTGILTIILVGATVLVSPAFFPRESLVRIEYVFVVAPMAVALLGLALRAQYKKGVKSA